MSSALIINEVVADDFKTEYMVCARLLTYLVIVFIQRRRPNSVEDQLIISPFEIDSAICLHKVKTDYLFKIFNKKGYFTYEYDRITRNYIINFNMDRLRKIYNEEYPSL